MILELIIVGVIVCLTWIYIYDVYLSPLKHIPDPSNFAIFGQTFQFTFNNDHVSMLAGWREKFKEQGLCRIRSLIGENFYQLVPIF